jgi:hypothetical protein
MSTSLIMYTSPGAFRGVNFDRGTSQTSGLVSTTRKGGKPNTTFRKGVVNLKGPTKQQVTGQFPKAIT